MAGRRTFFFDGLGVSDGYAIGPACVIEARGIRTEGYQLAEDAIEAEIERLHRAIELARQELEDIRKQVEEKIDRQQAAIFDAHLMMLDDPMWIERTIERIRRDQRNAEAVLWEVTQTLSEQMKALGDAYFSERNHDLFDVARRVIKFLAELTDPDHPSIPKDGCIIVANDLGPAETASFSREAVMGFCINEGGQTSHTAIMAKALSIPAVVGLEYITHYVRSGDLLVLDGLAGKVILNPTDVQLAYYRARMDEFAARRRRLAALRHLPAATTDGIQVALMANIEFPVELDAVEEHGAEGIGLFRTEYLYMDEDCFHDWDRHVSEYRMVFDRMGDRPVVLRTLDLGGDKLPDKERWTPEANPFLGLRAIRLCLARTELFRAQIRALLRAGAGRDLRILIPMVSALEEVRAARRLIDECRSALDREGVSLPRSIKVGVMIEIPSAALIAPALAREVDFFSIGTNDLVQYTLAVDRVNKNVANLYQPTHPAVLQLIRMTIDGAAAHDIPVAVCGEMAADPRLAVLLVGMGVRELSMSPASLAEVKKAIRGVSIEDARRLAHDVLGASTAGEAEALLHQGLNALNSSSTTAVRVARGAIAST